MSYPFPLPSAESIQVESRLLPEMVDVSFPDMAAFVADIQLRIPGAAAVVMKKLRKCADPFQWPLPSEMVAAALEGETPADIEDALADDLTIATRAVSLRVQSGLNFTAKRQSDGIRLSEESNALIDLICAGIGYVVGKQPEVIAEDGLEPVPRSTSRRLVVRI